jgi:hypothetical protein
MLDVIQVVEESPVYNDVVGFGDDVVVTVDPKNRKMRVALAYNL